MSRDSRSSLFLYQKLYTSFVEQFPALHAQEPKSQFQFPMRPTPAAWGEGTPGARAFESYRIGDRTPGEHGLFYEPSGSVSRLFRAWVGAVRFTPGRPDCEYQALINAIAGLYERQWELLAEAEMGFALWRRTVGEKQDPEMRKTLDDWLLETAGRAELTDLEAEISRLNALLSRYVMPQDRLLLHVRNANRVDVENPNLICYADPRMPAGRTTILSLAEDLRDWRAGAQWKPLPLTIDQRSPVTHRLYTVGSMEEGAYPSFFGLFGVDDVISRRFTDEVAAADGFTLTIQMGGMGLYHIYRAEWWGEEAIRAYMELALVDPLHTPEPYFDRQTGSLALVPERVLVGWNPSVTLTMPGAAYDKHWRQLEAGIRVGPFIAGAGAPPASMMAGNQVQVNFQSGDPKTAPPFTLGVSHQLFCLKEADRQLSLAGVGEGESF